MDLSKLTSEELKVFFTADNDQPYPVMFSRRVDLSGPLQIKHRESTVQDTHRQHENVISESDLF